MDATRVAKPCPWCHEKTRNLSHHIKNCKKAKKEGAASRNEDEEATERVVRVLRHKTSTTTRGDGGLPLILDARFFKVSP